MGTQAVSYGLDELTQSVGYAQYSYTADHCQILPFSHENGSSTISFVFVFLSFLSKPRGWRHVPLAYIQIDGFEKVCKEIFNNEKDTVTQSTDDSTLS